MKIIKLDMPKIKGKRIHVSLALEQKLHQQTMEQLDREIPLPGAKARGFVFTH